MENFRKIELRKTRDFGEKINVTFEFIRQNYKALFTCILFISVPFSLIGVIFQNYYTYFVGFSDVTSAIGVGVVTIIAFILIFIGYLFNAAVTNNFVVLYDQKENPLTITPSEVWAKVKEDVGSLLAAYLLVGIVLMISFIFFVIPGIYLMVVLSLITPIIVIERKSIGDAFSRCFALIKEKWWSTFGLLIVMVIIQSVLVIVFSIPQYILLALLNLHTGSDATNVLTGQALWLKLSMMLSSILSTIGNNLVSPLTSLAIVFQFFNLVERQEAKGLMSQLENFGKKEETPGSLGTPMN